MERVPGDFVPVAKERWAGFFDSVTKALEGKRTEIEVAGLDLGDQVQADVVVLNGVTYDRKDDTFYVYAADGENDLDHAIAHPREIHVSMRSGVLDRVVVVDPDGRLHVITLREALAVPPTDVG